VSFKNVHHNCSKRYADQQLSRVSHVDMVNTRLHVPPWPLSLSQDTLLAKWRIADSSDFGLFFVTRAQPPPRVKAKRKRRPVNLTSYSSCCVSRPVSGLRPVKYEPFSHSGYDA
jgi:hypothetical protein